MTGRRTALSLTVAALTVSALALTGAPAQADGATNIRVLNSRHCLDNATENEAKLQMWTCGGGNEQMWQTEDMGGGLFRFNNEWSNRCITAPSWPAVGQITMGDCYPSLSTQLWRRYATGPSGMVMWQSAYSGECMTTPSVANGTAVLAQTCETTDQYDWWQ
ncbi:ricin-type beta-trefoil lectin domain protein [Kitasatospora sp. NPDC002227]|uniref:RICIN domain-containing protein n=1 Tax=Kitasatospora sp. NPDC002227 TaxID=3154773 RepID=UPI00332EF64C